MSVWPSHIAVATVVQTQYTFLIYKQTTIIQMADTCMKY